MIPPEFPPGIGPHDFTWHHAVCPSCGRDWWHGSQPEDELSPLDVAWIVAALGVCGDCRERTSAPPRAVRGSLT